MSEEVKSVLERLKEINASKGENIFLPSLGKKVKFQEVLKGIRKRDRADRTRPHSKLKKTRESYLINTSNLTIKESFLKVKNIIDRKLHIIWKK